MINIASSLVWPLAVPRIMLLRVDGCHTELRQTRRKGWKGLGND